MMKGPRGALRLIKRAEALSLEKKGAEAPRMAVAPALFPPPFDFECILESPVHLIQLC
jgi:hypothetical protein